MVPGGESQQLALNTFYQFKTCFAYEADLAGAKNAEQITERKRSVDNIIRLSNTVVTAGR